MARKIDINFDYKTEVKKCKTIDDDCLAQTYSIPNNI